MALHGLVEVKRGHSGCIKPRQPHGTHKHQLQGVLRVFEVILNVVHLFIKLIQPLDVGLDVQPLFLELFLIGFRVTDDYGHLDCFHIIPDLLEAGFLHLVARLFG